MTAIEFKSLAFRVTFGAIVGFLAGVISFTWGISSAFSEVKAQLETIRISASKNENKILEVEKEARGHIELLVTVRESIVRLATKMDSVGEQIKDVKNDVKEIRTMVK